MRMYDNKIAIFVPWVQLLCSEWQDHQGLEMKCFPERRRDQLGHQTWKIATDMFAHRFTYFWCCCFCCSSIYPFLVLKITTDTAKVIQNVADVFSNRSEDREQWLSCLCFPQFSLRSLGNLSAWGLDCLLPNISLHFSRGLVEFSFLLDFWRIAYIAHFSLVGWMHFSPACKLCPSKLRDDATDWIHLQSPPTPGCTKDAYFSTDDDGRGMVDW